MPMPLSAQHEVPILQTDRRSVDNPLPVVRIILSVAPMSQSTPTLVLLGVMLRNYVLDDDCWME